MVNFMKQEQTTKLNLRMSDDLNNNSVMIPSILNDNKQKTYSNREKLIPIEQSHSWKDWKESKCKCGCGTICLTCLENEIREYDGIARRVLREMDNKEFKKEFEGSKL